VTGVRLASGTTLRAGHVVIAAGPAVAHALAPESEALARAHALAVPVRAACLDLALTELPFPRRRFMLGIDEPLYVSVHSAYAALAPEGGAVVHAARYLAPDETGDEGELERLVERLQPGFAKHVAIRRWLPSMTVTHAVVTAAQGGLAGRISPAVSDVAGLWVVGDWVGQEGMLADASLASAERAATEIIETMTGIERAPAIAAVGP
jgi:hypothetical protein